MVDLKSYGKLLGIHKDIGYPPDPAPEPKSRLPLGKSRLPLKKIVKQER